MKKPLALSIICTSLAMPVFAQEGCFARDYSAAHLEANPEQVVAGLRVFFSADNSRPGTRYAEITATMARQGHALRRGAGGMVLEEFALCTPEGLCSVACDGGSFVISAHDGDRLEIRTTDARVSAQPCTPGTVVSTLADTPGEITTHVLTQAVPSRCGR